MELSLELNGEKSDFKREILSILNKKLKDVEELPTFPQGSSKHYMLLSRKETLEEIINLIKRK